MTHSWKFSFMVSAFAVALGLFYILLLRAVALQISPAPEYRNEPYPDISTQELCEEAGGTWTKTSSVKNTGVTPVQVTEQSETEFCQGPLAFEREQEIQLEKSRQTSLLVFAIGGALAIAVALLWQLARPVSPGLMVGGIVSFVVTAVHVWMLSASLGRLITLIVIFAALLAAGLYAFRDSKK